MKLANAIVNALLEADEVDPKDFLDRHGEDLDNAWEHIDGDVNAWEYGGAFYNPATEEIVYIPGLQSEGIEDKASWDMELSAQDMAAIMAQFPVVIEPELPEYGDENADAREEAIEARKQELADEANANQKMAVYRFSSEPVPEDEWMDVAAIKAGYDDPSIWYDMSDAVKWVQVGRHHGFHELDHSPAKYTKAELEKYLNRKL